MITTVDPSATLVPCDLKDGGAARLVALYAEDPPWVRALVSARNASEHWDLRCDVRERLVAWLRDLEGGRYLPRVRIEGEDASRT